MCRDCWSAVWRNDAQRQSTNESAPNAATNIQEGAGPEDDFLARDTNDQSRSHGLIDDPSWRRRQSLHGSC